MQTDIEGATAFGHLKVVLEPNESLTVESDGMASMDADLDMTTQLNGGFFTGLARKYLGGETLFINRFTNNTAKPRSMVVVQPVPGEIRCRELKGGRFFLQPGAYLASTSDVNLGLKWAGFVSWIAREGLFRIEVSGDGQVWYGAYGALVEKSIDGEYIVDTSHLVAYEEGIQLKLQLASGIFSSFFGGEGLVTRVTGKGKIIVQTRSLSGLAGWINPKFWV